MPQERLLLRHFLKPCVTKSVKVHSNECTFTGLVTQKFLMPKDTSAPTERLSAGKLLTYRADSRNEDIQRLAQELL